MVSGAAGAGRPVDPPGTGEETWASWPGLGAFPVAGIPRWRSAVLLFAHPDDEILGAGGVIAALAAAGARLRLPALAGGFDVCLAPWEHDAHPDHEAVGRAARHSGAPLLVDPVWMWHWPFPGRPAVPWERAVQVPLTPGISARNRLAIGCFRTQLSPRDDTGPVLPSEIVAHFTRTAEVFFR